MLASLVLLIPIRIDHRGLEPGPLGAPQPHEVLYATAPLGAVEASRP